MQRTCTKQSLAVRGVANMAKRGLKTGKRGDHD
jgi:hypothetical protein